MHGIAIQTNFPEEIAKVILKKPDLRYVVSSDANFLIKKRKRLKENSLN